MKYSSVLFVVFFMVGQAFAQMTDMRAFSRQRGYRAYRTEHSSVQKSSRNSSIERFRSQERPETEHSFQNGNSPTGESDLPDERDQEKIRQTGIKIFQEKDESKVMNFNVENPEFKKLNKKQQQDLLNRITFEQSQAR